MKRRKRELTVTKQLSHAQTHARCFRELDKVGGETHTLRSCLTVSRSRVAARSSDPPAGVVAVADSARMADGSRFQEEPF